MASFCPAIVTGDQFLTRIVTNIDCQTQMVGSLGWQALAQPGSLASTVMAGLLTIFVALFGIRLLFGPTPGARDVVLEVLKVGVVLTLAFSWPAVRTLIHDVVIEGPGEIGSQLAAPVRPDDGRTFLAQLQAADDAILRLTEAGTGRQVGAFVDRNAAGGTFRGTALEDETGFGNARLMWLAGLIGAFALMRLAAGLLLALGPLAAGMLLFEATRGLFTGWLRGLMLALIGTVSVTVVLAVELGVLMPWLTDALRIRRLGYAAPAAPTELFAMTLAFTIVQFAMIAILAKVAFARGWLTLPQAQHERLQDASAPHWRAPEPREAFIEGRARGIASAVELQLRREEGFDLSRGQMRSLASRGNGDPASPASGTSIAVADRERLGSSWRRTHQRGSMAARKRDTYR